MLGNITEPVLFEQFDDHQQIIESMLAKHKWAEKDVDLIKVHGDEIVITHKSGRKMIIFYID